ncbi:MAG: hypothetical protein ACX93I_14185 [Winogradskyella sp.]
MNLVFIPDKLNKPKFKWNCSFCKKATIYNQQIHIDFANEDFKSTIDNLKNMSYEEQEKIINEIKSQMVNILNHFIECDKGWHYNAIFKCLIKPYLDNPLVLDFVLKSDVIKATNFKGITGAKIYPELQEKLIKVDSPYIKNYLKHEFKTTGL